MTEHRPYFDRVLADCLEAMIMDGRSIPSLLNQYPDYREELAEMLTVAKVAHKLPGSAFDPITRPEPRLQVKPQPAASRSIVDEIIPWFLFLLSQLNPSPKPGLAAASWALVAALVVVLFAGTGVGVAYAADGASPGEPLYGLDRATEQVRMALTFNPDEKAQLGLNLAQERLAEARTLSEGDSPIRYIYQALVDYEAQIEAVAGLLSGGEGQLDDSQLAVYQQALSLTENNQRLTINRVANAISNQGNGGVRSDEANAGNSRSAAPPESAPNSIDAPVASSIQTAPGIGSNRQASNSAVDNPGLHGRLKALEAHLNQAELEIQRGNPQAAKIALAKHDNQVHLLAQSLHSIEDDSARLQALQALLEEAQSRRNQVLSQLLEQLPPSARAGLEQALSAGGGPPETVPGSGPPDGNPGNGPPDDVPGNGPPDGNPGNGPPQGAPGGGRGNQQ